MNEQSSAGTSKRNRSLSWRLSFSQMRQQIASYIKINLLLALLFFVMLVIWSESTANTVYNNYYPVSQTGRNLDLSENQYVELSQSNIAQGFRFPKFLENQGVVQKGSYRQISSLPVRTELAKTLSHAQNYPAYKVFIPVSQQEFLEVLVRWEKPTAFFKVAIICLVIYQILSLPFIILRSRRRIRKALQPLYELTATAQNISSADLSVPLSGTIDTLNAITGNHLDRRISISDEREELQGLAQAINNMLDRLDLSYKAQLQFVSDASHELRTPISIIQGYAQLIDRWGKDDPQTLQESITAIQSETKNMQTLVEQLLFLARSDNRSLQLDSSTVNVSDLMLEVYEETKMIAKHHEIQENIQPNIFLVIDPQLIKQAVRILVDNAIKYTPENGRITLGLEQQNESVLIHISDNGVGISAENLENLFNRFWRADSSRTRKTGGTGLGLSIAKWISESHNGYIEVVSRENFGSKFTIVLPLGNYINSSSTLKDESVKSRTEHSKFSTDINSQALNTPNDKE